MVDSTVPEIIRKNVNGFYIWLISHGWILLFTLTIAGQLLWMGLSFAWQKCEEHDHIHGTTSCTDQNNLLLKITWLKPSISKLNNSMSLKVEVLSLAYKWKRMAWDYFYADPIPLSKIHASTGRIGSIKVWLNMGWS